MFSYKPLLKLLVDKEISKTELCKQIKCSSYTISKLSKNEYISMDVLDRICSYLNCKIEDVIEFIPDKKTR